MYVTWKPLGAERNETGAPDVKGVGDGRGVGANTIGALPEPEQATPIAHDAAAITAATATCTRIRSPSLARIL